MSGADAVCIADALRKKGVALAPRGLPPLPAWTDDRRDGGAIR